MPSQQCKIFLSDEGFGHLVRQRAICEQITKLDPSISATVQTGSYAEVAAGMFGSARLIKRFNNIHWARQKNGSPDLQMIREFFDDYEIRSSDFIEQERASAADFDFFISDFVYEAFPVGEAVNKPVFGVAHFTWDWFFSKMYPIPISYRLLEQMQVYAKLASKVYFPPFTPREIHHFYGDKAIEVPLIVGEPRFAPELPQSGKFHVLLMDSGASVLSEHMAKAVEQLSKIESIHFLIAEKFKIEADNVTLIPKDQFFSDYIPLVDLVITRGGFNTISECIAHRTPLLLLGEPMNPEIERNLLAIKEQQLGSFVSLEKFVSDLSGTISGFVDHEYSLVKKQMDSHEYRTDGASVIAHDILETVYG